MILRCSKLSPTQMHCATVLPGRQRLSAAVVRGIVGLYFGLVFAAWFLLCFAGDSWWLATIVLFGPRFVFALPLVILIPLAAIYRPRWLVVLLLSLVVVVGPLMGLRLPGITSYAAGKNSVRVLTWNVMNGSVDQHTLEKLLREVAPDIVAFQEHRRNEPLAWPTGWQSYAQDGLLVASRFPIRDIVVRRRQHPPARWPQVHALRCVVETPSQPVHFCSLHLRTPRRGLDQVLDRWTIVQPTRRALLVAETEQRRLESQHVARWLAEAPRPSIIAGDFNMPTESTIYRQVWSSYKNAFSRAGAGLWLHEMDDRQGLSLRFPYRPRARRSAMANSALLGGAERRFGPSTAHRGFGAGHHLIGQHRDAWCGVSH